MKRVEEMMKGSEEEYRQLAENSNSMDGSVGRVLPFDDITEHKRMEEKLRTYERKFMAVFMTGLDAICIATLEEGRILEANDQFEQLFGYSLEEVIGRTSLELNLYCDPLDRVRTVSEIKAHGCIRDFVTKAKRKDGQARIVSLSISSIPIGNEPHILAVIKDITDHKRAEEALEDKSSSLEDANTALTVLLSRIETDRANIENAILVNVQKLIAPYIEELRSTRLSDSQAALLDVVASNLENIVSPFIQKLAAVYSRFTPTEIRVAGLIKDGKTTKEIARLLKVGMGTVASHRNSIRIKLGLDGKKINLRVYLLSL
jgi:PAS domain S-box-containing protein